MKGSIRAAVGMLVVLGSVGAIERDAAPMIVMLTLAVVGLAILASGVSAMARR